MNGTRIPRSVAALILAVAGWLWLQASSAGDSAPRPARPPGKDKVEAKKPDAPTKRISGRAFDPHGTPVPGATLWLTRNDERDRYLPIPEVLAEAQSCADGRFDLALVESVLKQQAQSPDAELEISDLQAWPRRGSHQLCRPATRGVDQSLLANRVSDPLDAEESERESLLRSNGHSAHCMGGLRAGDPATPRRTATSAKCRGRSRECRRLQWAAAGRDN